jgi:predicted NAD/FAD-dependent oxidoreductase
MAAVKGKTARAAQPVGAAGADGPRVAVLGGGLAGMTAALKLAECGFRVTLYEEKDVLGGNASSRQVDGKGPYHDVYPHMFCSWYANVWHLLEKDLGLSREKLFAPHRSVHLMDRNGTVRELMSATSLEAMWRNLTSGVMSVPDMFLLGFSMLDLASSPFQLAGAEQLMKLDVNGFIYSRGYATERIAQLHNYMLMLIWSIQSDVTAAASYQDFIRHTLTFPDAQPFAWLMKGSLAELIIAPWEAKLRALGVNIALETRVLHVSVQDGRPSVQVQHGHAAHPHHEEYDYLVSAVPAPVLVRLAMEGKTGGRIIDRLPKLAELQRFRDATILVCDVRFKMRLPDIPPGQVGLAQSLGDLSFLDISQLWEGRAGPKGETVLVLAASDSDALPTLDPHAQAYQMIAELARYLKSFRPGEHWGDPASDIDWEQTVFQNNAHHRLFIDDVESMQWRPHCSYDELPRVSFAGDFCRTDVDMATVEAAVESGLQAAMAIQQVDSRGGKPRGDPITVIEHEVYGKTTLLGAKLALLPFAYAATAWSAISDATTSFDPKAEVPGQNWEAAYALILPMSFALDWVKTAYWFSAGLVADSRPLAAIGSVEERVAAAEARGTLSPWKPVLDVAARAADALVPGRGGNPLEAAADLLDRYAEMQPTRADTARRRAGAEPAGATGHGPGLVSMLSGLVLKAAQAADSAITASQWKAPAQAPHKRRWRPKY